MSLQRLADIAQFVQQAGDRFFDSLTEHLAGLLALPGVELWEIVGPCRTAVRPLAIWDRGRASAARERPAGPYLEVLDNRQIVLEQAGYVGTPLVGSTGRVLGCLAMVADGPLDTSRQPQLIAQLFAPLASAELERRQALRGSPGALDRPEDLLGTAIHELRDPLSGLVNAAEVLNQSASLDGQAQWAAEVVDRQSRNLVALMDDLSAASDLTQGKLELQFEDLDLEQVVREAIDLVRPILTVRQQELTLETALDPLPVRGDRRRLLQVLTRLLDHAARQAVVGATLALSARATPEQVVVRLTGAVMAGRLGALPDRRLGLMMVQRLVALHGGSLAAGAAGDAPDQALDIELRLPARPTSGASAAARCPNTAGAARARRVLVVDDEYDSAQALGMALQRRGHQVHIVHNGRAALEALPVFQPDAVLLDIGLPGLDGLEVARAIRAMPAHGHLTLIAATGLGWSEDRQRSRQAGFDHHLVKPLALDEVDRALAQARTGHPPPVTGS